MRGPYKKADPGMVMSKKGGYKEGENEEVLFVREIWLNKTVIRHLRRVGMWTQIGMTYRNDPKRIIICVIYGYIPFKQRRSRSTAHYKMGRDSQKGNK